MRMIKCNPQPVLISGDDRYLIPSNPENLEQGGTYFTYPIYSLITGEKVNSFEDMEFGIKKIDNIWYWVKED